MWIASRTPEGEPARCGICGVDVWIEPALETRDGVCPSCGSLVWFGTPAPISASDLRLQVRDRVFGRALQKFGWPITAGTSFVAEYPRGDGSAWLEAVERANDRSEFVARIQDECL
jgi:hypothetical protein